MSVDVHNAVSYVLFFFNDTATTEIYTLSLHDALPILSLSTISPAILVSRACSEWTFLAAIASAWTSKSRFRSEEHTSELQSQSNLVCRLLLEKKKKYKVDVE